MRRRWLVLALLAGACAAPPPAPLPAGASHTVAVLPPATTTAEPPPVAGTSLLERYATGTGRVTVADVVASEARLQLAARGFTVLPPDDVDAATQRRVPGNPAGAAAIAAAGKLPGLALYLEIRRWEPDVPTHPSYVLVGARAALVDPATAAVVWSNERAVAPVATPGEVGTGASVTAARKVVEELLAPLGRTRPEE